MVLWCLKTQTFLTNYFGYIHLNGMTKGNGEKLGTIIGKVLLVDNNECRMGWKKFLRFMIIVDIIKLFARGHLLNLGDKQF